MIPQIEAKFNTVTWREWAVDKACALRYNSQVRLGKEIPL
jgi:hypothetical protein